MKAERFLLVSDTHGRIGNLCEVLKQSGPFDGLIFCGDGEGLERHIRALVGKDCRVYLVRGNCDGGSELPDDLIVPLGRGKAFVTHGDGYGVRLTRTRIAEEAASLGCNYCFYGHTHRPEKELIGGVLCINPGSISYPRQEDHLPSYTVIELDEEGEAHVHMARLKS